ncbi:hypothetical protein NL676_012154 [Syzygium grande]|nr:hypothetical protein NL676_012154 [Syzygium grande]
MGLIWSLKGKCHHQEILVPAGVSRRRRLDRWEYWEANKELGKDYSGMAMLLETTRQPPEMTEITQRTEQSQAGGSAVISSGTTAPPLIAAASSQQRVVIIAEDRNRSSMPEQGRRSSSGAGNGLLDVRLELAMNGGSMLDLQVSKGEVQRREGARFTGNHLGGEAPDLGSGVRKKLQRRIKREEKLGSSTSSGPGSTCPRKKTKPPVLSFLSRAFS